MIYELRGKIPQNSSFIYSEDVLTSTIFGNLRYLSSPDVLRSFLSKAIDLQKQNYSCSLSNLINYHFWNKYPKKNSSQINEPDLLLEDDQNVIIIECKYHSPLDENFSKQESDYTNQLLRYSTIIDEYYFRKKNKTIIFLTLENYDYEVCLKKTISKLSPDISLYWLNWEALYPILETYSNSNLAQNEKFLVDDLLKFMRARNFDYFKGIKNYKNQFKWQYTVDSNYIFASKFNSFSWRYKDE
jgi:hypothetical protein